MDNVGWRSFSQPLGQVRLRLDEPAEGEEPPAHDISAAAAIGDTLFLGADECAALEILHRSGDCFAGHRRVELRRAFDLPGGDTEMDVEGLAIADGWLWVVGSHSLTRKKPKKGRPLDHDALARLAKLKDNHNRMFLGRLPLRADGADRWDVCISAHEGRRPQMLPVGKHVSPLLKLLRHDPILGPFTAIPSKENGLDVEGLIVDGARVGFGLRGPVINGWAVVVEVSLRCAGAQLEIAGGVTKHFLDLNGLGVRDLKRRGDDIFVLAGPTMKLDGPARVYRWTGEQRARAGETWLHHPEPLLELPFGQGCDHPEALATIRREGSEALLVVCDTPAPRRLADGAVIADLFPLG